jgi:hypothetical protein
MTARHEELFAGWLDSSLTPAEQEELLAALRADEILARAFARDVEIHRGLQFSSSRSEAGDRRAADRILHYVRASQEATSFAERVNQRARRTSRSVRSGPSSFVPWLAAAAFVIAIVAAVVAFRRENAAPQPIVEPRREPEVEKVARPSPRPVAPERPKPKEDDADRRRRIEEELRSAVGTKRIETAPKREESKPALPGEKPVVVPEKPDLAKPEPTRVESPPAIATLESAQGEVVGLRPGAELRDGATVETAGTAVVKFLDGTRVGVSGEARIHEKLAGKRASGKGVTLARGALAADVAKQPAGTAFLFVTPHAEVQVVGTRLSIQSGGETRVDVQEGQVRVTSHKGGPPVTLAAGQGSEVGPAGAPRPFVQGLQAFYFDQNTFKGQVLERVDPAIDLFLDEAKGELPPVGSDRTFAVRWQGRFLAEAAGEYAFVLHVDGQSRFAMDGESLVSEPRGVFHPGERTVVRRKLAAGWHDLVLEYTDDSGSSRCGLRFVPPSAPMPADNGGYAIPPRLFTHNRR